MQMEKRKLIMPLVASTCEKQMFVSPKHCSLIGLSSVSLRPAGFGRSVLSTDRTYFSPKPAQTIGYLHPASEGLETLVKRRRCGPWNACENCYYNQDIRSNIDVRAIGIAIPRPSQAINCEIFLASSNSSLHVVRALSHSRASRRQ